jgi:hypothetical protein
MKITKKLAAATLVPAAVAGITVSSLAVVQASADQPGQPQDPVRHAAAAKLAQPSAHHVGAHKKTSKAAAESLNRARHAKAGHRHAAHAKAHRRAHAKPAPAAAQPAPSATSMFAGMSSFERCVAWRESGDNPAASSAGLFGILPSTWASLGYQGTAGTSSVALQKQAFDRLYSMYGTSPWAPYDGC